MSTRLISVDSEESVESRGENMVTTAHGGCRPATEETLGDLLWSPGGGPLWPVMARHVGDV